MRETVTATGRRRNRWLLLVAMTALGLGLVGMGAIAQEYPYGSALLLQFGSTLVLVAPLFFVERQLNARVEALHAALRGITFAPGVSSSFQSELAPQLQSYQEYLRGIGYEVDRRPVTIVTASSQDRPILSSTMATYSAAENEMLIDVRYVRQPGVMLRAYSHHILNLNTSSPSSATRGPWGSRIGSALAFYLPAAASNDPNLLSALGFGSLSDQVEIDRVQAEQWTDPVEVGWHWAKVFWLIRTRVSASEFDLALAETWASGPSFDENPYPMDFLATLLDRLRRTSGERAVAVARIALKECSIPDILRGPGKRSR